MTALPPGVILVNYRLLKASTFWGEGNRCWPYLIISNMSGRTDAIQQFDQMFMLPHVMTDHGT